MLPFENLDGDKADTVFADGIQDDILTKLAKVAGLKVISRTSVMQYRGTRNTGKSAKPCMSLMCWREACAETVAGFA